MKKKIKILLLINWHISYFSSENKSMQLSDQCFDKKYWFFKYFKEDVDVDVIDTRSLKFIEHFEKKHLRIYIMQTLRILNKIKKYDIIISHGTTSAIFLDFIRQCFKKKTPPHIVIDISSFHQASTKGIIFKLCQFASKSIDCLVYHTPKQGEYFDEQFPWLKEKKEFISFGVDEEYWSKKSFSRIRKEKYIVCVGYRLRDWDTLIKAYQKSNKKYKLVLIGNPDLNICDEMIEVKPFIPVKELMNYIYGAKFSILPLDSYNFSYGQMTLLQQMAMGKVVLLSDVPPVESYVSEGLFRYKAKDVADLTKKLNELYSIDENKIMYLGKVNKEKCKTEYSERKMALELEKTIINVLRR